jgi:hypothetical protein
MVKKKKNISKETPSPQAPISLTMSGEIYISSTIQNSLFLGVRKTQKVD